MIHLYRLALRLFWPAAHDRHGAEIVATAGQLSRAAKARGAGTWARYWVSEFRSLLLSAWHDRSPQRSFPMLLSELLRDARYSLRLLARTPGVTLVALVTLALGIGANTAIFSVVNGVLLKPLAYPDSDRLYLIQHVLLSDRSQQGSTTPGNFYDLQRSVKSMQMAAISTSSVTLTGRGDPERLLGVESAGSILQVLGVAPQIGRIFTEDDDRIGAPKTVVISDGLWRRLFDSRPDAIGQDLALGGEHHTIVGVMPRGFTFPDTQMDLWMPAQFTADMRASRTEFFLLIVARLVPGATEATARGELDAEMARLRQEFPLANGTVGLDAQPLRESLVSNVSEMLWVLMGTVGCVLLIACANLANLLLARATGRTREMAIRQAIGAGRGRLVRQLLMESLVLAALGAIAGIAAGRLFLAALVAWLPAGIPRIAEASVDARVLLVTFGAAAVTGVAFGLAPALQLAASAPTTALRDNTRTSTSRSPLRTVLVIGELAIALVLLSGAGLLVQSFVRMQRVNPGFSSDRLLTFQVRMEGPAYAKSPARIALVQRTVERLRALPGVTAAAASSYAPVTGRGTGAWFNLLARPWPAGTTPPGIPYRVITPEYFQTLQIPLVRGRVLTDRDGLNGTPSVVISESLAHHFWASPADGDPIGSEIYLGAPDNKLFDRATVVGIVKDVKLAGLGGTLTDAVYGLQTLMPWWRNFTYSVRTGGDPAALTSSVRQIVRELDPLLAVTNVESMTDIMRTSVAPTRASMLLVALFACVATVMAGIGVFGVMSYAVNLRVREMGIRLALGARPAEVRRMVVREGMTHALIGVFFGVGGALWLTRAMSSMLFDVKPGDPLTLAAVSTVLLAAAALACYLPARRATRVDPLIVLRTE